MPETATEQVQQSVLEKRTLSRYALLGLNGKPARTPTCRTTPSNRVLVEVSSASAHPGVPPTTYQRKWMQTEEDLTELEEMMVPSAVRSSHQARGPHHGRNWQLTDKVKVSKFTTGHLSKSGWTPINNPYWDTQLTEARSPGEIATRNRGHEVPSTTGSKAAGEMLLGAEESGQQNESPPFLDDKYFAHDGYLRYRKDSDRSRAKSKRSRILEEVEETEAVPYPKAIATEVLNGELDVTINTADLIDHKSLANSFNSAVTSLLKDQTTYGRKWELLGGDTLSPRTGQATPEKLTIRLRNIGTQQCEIHSFQKIPPEDIDWSNKKHIQEISRWRSEILRHHGLSLKRVNVMYTPEEDDWLILFHKKLKAVVETGRTVKMPGPVPTMEAFNNYFEGRILETSGGDRLPPRQARDETSLKGKLSNTNSTIWGLRDDTRRLLEGTRGGKLYVPIVTEAELRRYQEDSTFTTDDPDDVSKNAALGREAIVSRRPPPKRKSNETDSDKQESKRVKLSL